MAEHRESLPDESDDRESLPDELFEALSQADAWAGWEEQPADVQALYVTWVSRPRRARERRERAETTAYYAAHGALDKAIRRGSPWEAITSILPW
ncbi:YdeI/OmpD-associated family protein [Frankia sp. QA3]|uniref:YdeI/OmpD-associated family protein n=1 Tax=Frankia sp. QA3 TaxID=710111 RepID=UPI000269CF24|nr:YdeI/OmpD-associated family protein [Frankia sp. QA3]EIV96289.1 hypothetical protein FraQA3DRAFT_6168 [Frankia sp. QA3]